MAAATVSNPTFTATSFNIWAPYWNPSECDVAKSKPHEDCEWWKPRQNELLSLLAGTEKSLNSDIYCLQEFWCENKVFCDYYEKYLSSHGYLLFYQKRTWDIKPDGIAIAIKKKSFRVLKVINVGYSYADRICQLAIVEYIKNSKHKKKKIQNNNNNNNTETVSSNITDNNTNNNNNSEIDVKKFKLIIGNTHLLYPSNPKADRVLRDGQMRQFLNCLEYYRYDFEFVTMKSNQNDEFRNDLIATLLFGDLNCPITGNCAQKALKHGYISTYHQYNVIQNLKNKNNNSKTMVNTNLNNKPNLVANNTNSEDYSRANSNENENENESIVNEDDLLNGIDMTDECNKLPFISHCSHEGKQEGCDFIMEKNNESSTIGYLKIVESFLYPRNLDTIKFPSKEDWYISDHRPLTTRFEFINTQNMENNNNDNNNEDENENDNNDNSSDSAAEEIDVDVDNDDDDDNSSDNNNGDNEEKEPITNNNNNNNNQSEDGASNVKMDVALEPVEKLKWEVIQELNYSERYIIKEKEDENKDKMNNINEDKEDDDENNNDNNGTSNNNDDDNDENNNKKNKQSCNCIIL